MYSPGPGWEREEVFWCSNLGFCGFCACFPSENSCSKLFYRPSFCCSYNPTFRPKHNYKLKHFATIEDSFVLMHTSTRNSIASCSPHFLSFAFDHILFYFNLRNINKHYFTHFFWHNPLSSKKKVKTSARLSIIQKYKFCWLWLKFARTKKADSSVYPSQTWRVFY